MRLTRITLREFRSYRSASLTLGPALTVLHGENGAGKTNLLEALYFGCTGRSCRTTNEREVVSFGAAATRVEVEVQDDDGAHLLAVGFAPGQAKRMSVDGAAVERLLDSPHRPLVSVFLPDRLELVKGTPGGRRAHLDQFVTALWPARVVSRRAYVQVLAQRNALLGRVRGGLADRSQLGGWDLQLALRAIDLMADRRAAVELISPHFTALCRLLGLAVGTEATMRYRPRSPASSAEELREELAARVETDIERGYTGHGPHRDELLLSNGGHELRAYGSQGQQRLALLALLIAERRVLGENGRPLPVMLLDDVMSELDFERRGRLVEVLEQDGGQALITTTDPEHVPEAAEVDIRRLAVRAGAVLEEVAG